MARFYLSNIRDAWPISRQEELLDRAMPGWRDAGVYRDILSKRAIERSAKLVQRDDFLLRETGRTGSGGEVVVAALPVLARTPSDLTSVLVRLAGRHETLRSIAEEMVVDPGSTDLDELKRTFNNAARRFSALGVPGGIASGQKRSAEALAKIELIKPFWPLLEPSTNELCKRYGVSRPTVIFQLGPRRPAQLAYQDDLRRQMAALKVAEANRKRRKHGKESDTDDE
jgi:hypothetical protein